MKVKQCSQCKGIFQAYANESICPRCMEKLDQDYLKVREYLYQHPLAGIPELANGTGVDEKHILNFLKAERLSLAEAPDELRCVSCSKPVTKGKYCDACLISLNKEISRIMPMAQSIKENETIAQKDRMHLDYTRQNGKNY